MSTTIFLYWTERKVLTGITYDVKMEKRNITSENRMEQITYTKIGLQCAIMNAESNLDVWASKPWHNESDYYVEFWTKKLEELRAIPEPKE